MMRRRNVDAAKSEKAFQSAQRHYRQYGDKHSSDECFFRIHDCCRFIVASKCRQVLPYDFEDIVMDATIRCFAKFKEGENIEKLSSFCYKPSIGMLWDRHKRKVDSEESLDFIMENDESMKEDTNDGQEEWQ